MKSMFALKLEELNLFNTVRRIALFFLRGIIPAFALGTCESNNISRISLTDFMNYPGREIPPGIIVYLPNLFDNIRQPGRMLPSAAFNELRTAGLFPWPPGQSIPQ